jgi:hypothetical protein
MNHKSVFGGTVPMLFAAWNMDHVSNLQSPWLMTFRANESGAGDDCQNLSFLVGVPV